MKPAPNDMMRTGLQLSMLAWEAQMVVAMRMMGMAGLWSVLPSEDRRMVTEKPAAFAAAATAASVQAMSGRPDRALEAWTRSLRRETGGNLRRLVRRGPKPT